MLFKFKYVIQIVFLFLFILFLAISRVQVWMIIFIAATLGAFLYGRFYCGFICPTNTITEYMNRIYKKFGIRRIEVPDKIKSPVFRYCILALFLGAMVLTLGFGRKIPVLPILTIVGVIITLLFVPSLWHRYLCPYGIILGISGRFSKKFWHVNNDSCLKCDICEKNCPADAVSTEDINSYPVIDKSICLECLECVKRCPKKAILYN